MEMFHKLLFIRITVWKKRNDSMSGFDDSVLINLTSIVYCDDISIQIAETAQFIFYGQSLKICETIEFDRFRPSHHKNESDKREYNWAQSFISPGKVVLL